MIVERIICYLQHKGIAVSTFEKELGLGNTTISRAYKSGAAIGTDKLEKIISYCPDLSPLWLVTGEGEMIVGEKEKEEEAHTPIEVSVVRSGGAVVIADASFLENMIKDAVNKAIANG